jgi:hypothetical protein
MLLKQELAACQCKDSPEVFRDRLIRILTSQYPGRTIDALVCSPREALTYCNDVREEVGSECLFDGVILKALMNIRKRKDCPTGLRKPRSRRNLQRELQEAGCRMDASAFKELTIDCLADMYKSLTIDEIVCHPREAMALCNYARMRARCEHLPDDLILSTLMNIRKAS